MMHEKFMKRAVEIAVHNAENGEGPFGAVITKSGKLISESGNDVINSNDPTAHAEISAIRKAAKKLNTFDLSGCSIYCSCEPCPMCLGAIYWARIDKIYYAGSSSDAKDYGFDDEHIYNEINLPLSKREISFKQVMREQTLEAFKKWEANDKKIRY